MSLIDDIGNALRNVVGAVGNVLTTTVNAVADTLKSIVDTIAGLFNRLFRQTPTGPHAGIVLCSETGKGQVFRRA